MKLLLLQKACSLYRKFLKDIHKAMAGKKKKEQRK